MTNSRRHLVEAGLCAHRVRFIAATSEDSMPRNYVIDRPGRIIRGPGGTVGPERRGSQFVLGGFDDGREWRFHLVGAWYTRGGVRS